MILADKHYPIRKLLENHPTKRIYPNQNTPEFRNMMLKMLKLYDRHIEALQYHDLFRQLSGNPTSIVILASALANPMLNCTTMADLYKSAIQNEEDAFL